MNAPFSSTRPAPPRRTVAALAALLLFLPATPSAGQTAGGKNANDGNTGEWNSTAVRPHYSQAELDQMLAPIALYPDALLSQILMAATYPLEIVQAARWTQGNAALKGEAAVAAVAEKTWDPSVKSLVAFPQVLAQMDMKLDWTESLGNAFLAQQAQVMDTVQALRRRAYASGNMNSDDTVRIVEHRNVIVVEPADPALIPVPYYDPWVAYGPWRWSAYPPVRWAAWPGYAYVPSRVTIVWGPAVWLPFGFVRGVFDWHERRVYTLPHAAAYPIRIHRIAPWVHRHRGAVRVVAAPPPAPAITAIAPQAIGDAPPPVPTHRRLPAPVFQPRPQPIPAPLAAAALSRPVLQPRPQPVHAPLAAAAAPATPPPSVLMPGHAVHVPRHIPRGQISAPALRPPQAHATGGTPGTTVARAWPSAPAIVTPRPAPSSRPVRIQADRPAPAGNARFAVHRGHSALR